VENMIVNEQVIDDNNNLSDKIPKSFLPSQSLLLAAGLNRKIKSSKLLLMEMIEKDQVFLFLYLYYFIFYFIVL
jgi:hypothetical protein